MLCWEVCVSEDSSEARVVVREELSSSSPLRVDEGAMVDTRPSAKVVA